MCIFLFIYQDAEGETDKKNVEKNLKKRYLWIHPDRNDSSDSARLASFWGDFSKLVKDYFFDRGESVSGDQEAVSFQKWFYIFVCNNIPSVNLLCKILGLKMMPVMMMDRFELFP